MLEKLREYKRVIKISSKPSLEEYAKVVKITGLGMLIVGGMGILVQVIFQFLLGF